MKRGITVTALHRALPGFGSAINFSGRLEISLSASVN